MANANRIVLRRAWKDDHPAQFDRTSKMRAALLEKLAPRRSFSLYKIEKLNPKLYAKLVERALGKVGAKRDPEGEAIVDSIDKLDQVGEEMNKLAGGAS